MYLGDDMKENNDYIVDLYHDELTKLEEKEKRKIEKLKKKEEAKKRREEKKLEKKEDKEFARRQKMSREVRYNQTQQNNLDTIIPNVYKITIIITLFLTLSYFLYSLIKRQIYIFNSLLFTLIMLGFILISTIQKKKERKIISVITCILCILWMLLHL